MKRAIGCGKRFVFSVGLLCCAFGFRSQEKEGKGHEVKANGSGIQWQGDFQAALKTAKSEGKPLFVAFIMDNEVANDEVTTKHYTDPEIIKLSAKMICLIGNTGTHGAPGAPCSKFGTVTCEQHRAVEIKAREMYIKSEYARAPQHVFCGPGGEEIFRKVYLIPKDDLAKAMAIAIAGKAPAPGGAEAEVVTKERVKVEKLLKDLDSNNLEVRDAAFRGLAVADDPRALPAILDKSKSGNDETVRYSAIQALGVKGNFAAIKPLLGFLVDRSSRIVATSLSSIERIQLPDAVPDLLAFLKQKQSDRIRGRALSAMAKCLPESPQVQAVCIAALKGANSNLEGWALTSLGCLKADPKVAAAVKPLLTNKNETTRALSAWVLGKQRDTSVVPTLEKMAANDKSPEVRALVVKAIAYCKGEDVEGYDALYRSFHWEDDM